MSFQSDYEAAATRASDHDTAKDIASAIRALATTRPVTCPGCDGEDGRHNSMQCPEIKP